MVPTGSILMIRPDHYDVSYAINPWMDPQAWQAAGDSARVQAAEQWLALAAALRRAGAEVINEPGVADLPDMAFPANAAVVLDRVALLARFRHPERQAEEAPTHALFQRLLGAGHLDEVRLLPESVTQEGAGDALWDAARGHFWAAHGPRSSRDSLPVLAATFGQPVVGLELATRSYYHLDTCFCPLPGGEVMYYPPAFTPDSLRRIAHLVPASHRLEATVDEAAAFSLNAVAVGRTLVMATPPDSLRRRLEAWGYTVVAVDLSRFRQSGGGAYCMTLRLDRRSEAGATGIRRPLAAE